MRQDNFNDQEGLLRTAEQIKHIAIVDDNLPAGSQELLKSEGTVVFFSRSIQGEQRKQALEMELAALGKTSCLIQNAARSEHDQIWFSGREQRKLCQ